MGKIFIEGLEFYAFHGFFAEEQKIGGKYLVDIEIDADINEAANNDTLKGTIDYGLVAELVAGEMKIKSKLIEHVAGRILNRLLDNFSEIEDLTVKVTKLNPPIGVKLKSVSVCMQTLRKKSLV